jgi:hypothetical protein
LHLQLCIRRDRRHARWYVCTNATSRIGESRQQDTDRPVWRCR